MSTRVRIESETGIYHVLTRGVNKCDIFLSDRDYRKMHELLRAVSDGTVFEVFGWCFMTNHIHLLVRCDKTHLTKCMHDMLGAYAQYFNKEHDRIGALYQGRFTSKPVKSDSQFLTCLRYIHQNPQRALIAPAQAYPWSSYKEYVTRADIVCTEFALCLLGGVEGFIDFHRSEQLDYPCLDVDTPDQLEDDEAADIARKLTHLGDLRDIAIRRDRDSLVALLLYNNFKASQVSALSGLSLSTISRIKKREKKRLAP